MEAFPELTRQQEVEKKRQSQMRDPSEMAP